ncbi:MAG: exopolyphosphatase [Denitrovibrio sp.]|nr:MAG: exopolyphosphatase [Denitrovibrio sp.]
MKVASIDIGSNAVRLLIADVEGRKITKVHYKKRHITKLAEVLSSRKMLSNAAVERTLTALMDFVHSINNIGGVKRVHAVATSAVREATNSDLLLEAAKKFGLEIEVIDGDTEAGLIYDGITAGIDVEDKKTLMFDIGGGSTEFIYSNPETGNAGLSVPLGVVRMAELYNFKDKINMEDMDRMTMPIFTVLNTVIEALDCKPEIMIGSAGTPTTLAAMDMKMTEYDQEKVNGYVLKRANIEKHFKTLCEMPAELRVHIPGMEEGREEVIIPGILILTELMSMLGIEEIIVSDYGVREGLAVAIANV